MSEQDNSVNTGKRKFPLPLIGHRLLKTGAAVLICLLIYVIRGYQGMVGESVIAAIICLQPYVRDSRSFAVNRVIGTVIGAIWGLLFLVLMMVLPVLASNMIVVYVIMTIGTIMVMYICVAMKIADTASLAAIVYICVIIAFPDVESPVIQTINRVIDTTIGVCVAVFVNVFHWPTRKHPDKLFFLRLNDLVTDRYSRISSRILVELNRLYDGGAKICLETSWAPAFLISQLQMLRINMPVIVLEGACMYDIRLNMYLDIRDIQHDYAAYLYDYLNSRKRCGCVFAIRGNSMLLFHTGPKSPAEEENYMTMRRSPYRNYLDGSYTENDRIVAIRVIIDTSESDYFETELHADPFIDKHFRVVRHERPLHDSQHVFYFLRKDVSVENMEERLLDFIRKDLKADVDPVRIRPISAVFDPERDAHLLVHRIDRLFRTPILPFITTSEEKREKNRREDDNPADPIRTEGVRSGQKLRSSHTDEDSSSKRIER